MQENSNYLISEKHSGFRRKTRVVDIGGIPMGGNYPVRIQTMTNSSTLDTKTTVKQIIECANAGADYVRMAVRNSKEAENLAEIKSSLRRLGYNTPLIADIHFNPGLAEIAARIVEEVRINPGNYSDGNGIGNALLSEKSYATGLQKIRERFVQLLNLCKEHGAALRIGVNHGSLSQRILSKYGDTPAGMVESAMEFLHICNEENFHQVVVSLKSSNTRSMVLANQLMAAEMDKHNFNYPFHLGVTEAGNDEDGRIKSAAGIGMLLAMGIGDTIRVSLTEDPVNEIPVARKLVDYYSETKIPEGNVPINTLQKIRLEFRKRDTQEVFGIGGRCLPVVVYDLSGCEGKKEGLLQKNDLVPEFIYKGNKLLFHSISENTLEITDYENWETYHADSIKTFPFFSVGTYLKAEKKSSLLNLIRITSDLISEDFVEKIRFDKTVVLVLDAEKNCGYRVQREAFEKLERLKCYVPVIIRRSYDDIDSESWMLKAAADIGGLFIEGFGDGIWIVARNEMNTELTNTVSFSVLQASRARISKTEFISCPSCGRTQFNLEETTRQIKARTSHLKGLKIAIMGCFVNGPGEMADADYGYVGGGKGRVNLYKAKQLVKSGIPEEKSIDELIELIKNSGDWAEPA